MSIKRRALLSTPFLAPPVCLAAAAPVGAQVWPTRPLRLVVPYPPGGGTDIAGRLLAAKIGEVVGQPVVIDNRSGAGGVVGSRAVSQSSPDGHTMLFDGSLTVPKHDFDPRRDLTNVARIANTPVLLVVNAARLPAVGSVADLIARARSTPGALNHGTPGTMTTQHIAAEMFDMLAGTRITHVAYRGTGPAVNAVAAGEVEVMFASASAIEFLVRDGRVRALAICGPERSADWPGLPTVAETLPGYEAGLWYALSTAPGTPAPIVTAMEGVLERVLTDEAFAALLRARGFVPAFLPHGPLNRTIEAEMERWHAVIRRAGLRIE